MSQLEEVDPVDLCAMTLLRDLAELDSNVAQRTGYRSLLLKSAIESINYLERVGGGSLGLEALARLRDAVCAEIERLA